MEDEKMTICFLGNASSSHTINWARFFSQKGHNVHLFSFNEAETDDLRGIKMHVIKKRIPTSGKSFDTLLNLIFALGSVKKEIKEIDPDVLSAHYISSYGLLAVLIGIRPLVATAWGTDILINPVKNLIFKMITKFVLNKADLITCDAEHIKRVMLKLGADENKIKIINFGIDTKIFSPGEKDVGLLSELNIAKSPVIISSRMLDKIYSIDTLIKAVSLVIEKNPNAKFIIIGSGPEEENLKNIAKELGVLNNILFIGWVPIINVPCYLRIADIYVSTSLSDAGIASSTAEAMSCGLPAVITDFGDNKEWVKDNKNGFLFPIKDHKQLASKIIYLLDNPEMAQEMGKVGRNIIEEKNNYYKEMAKMEEIYRECHGKKFADILNKTIKT